MKDKNNLADYNCWSGTEYLKNRDGFYKDNSMNIMPSNIWSDIGETSLKISGLNNKNVDINRLYNLTAGDTITVSLIIYNPTTNCRCHIRTNEESIIVVQVPKSKKQQKVTISTIIPENISWITLRTFLNVDGEIYMDNIIINID